METVVAQLGSVAPVCVFYLETGGRRLGHRLAAALGVDSFGLDIRYPYSRLMDRMPVWVRPFLWLFKELVYRLTSPKSRKMDQVAPPFGRALLVDDRVSSGKSLGCALTVLSSMGWSRDQLTVVTGRCGRRCTHLVEWVVSD